MWYGDEGRIITGPDLPPPDGEWAIGVSPGMACPPQRGYYVDVLCCVYIEEQIWAVTSMG